MTSSALRDLDHPERQVEADHGQAHHHRLLDDDPVGVPHAREDEGAGLPQGLAQLVMVLEPLDEVDPVLEAEVRGESFEAGLGRPPADDVKLDWVAGPGHRLDDQVDPLVGDEPAVLHEPEVPPPVLDGGSVAESIGDAAVEGIAELGVAAAGDPERATGALAPGDEQDVRRLLAPEERPSAAH